MASEVKLGPGTSFFSCETMGQTGCVGFSLLYLYSRSEDAHPIDVTGLLQTPGDTEKLLKTPLQQRKNSIYPTSRMPTAGPRERGPLLARSVPRETCVRRGTAGKGAE